MTRQALIKEIGHEGAQTKKIIERIPFDRFDWKPHEKSSSIGKLAVHVATIPSWTSRILNIDDYDFLVQKFSFPEFHSTEEIVSFLQTNLEKAMEDVEKASDEELMKKWKFRRGEQVFFETPKLVSIRSFAMNHLVHHRGQLSVYLRLLDIPVPGMYGPSADGI